jgi:preprotein translocase subunit SecG
MTAFIVAIHITVCLLLMAIVLVQQGRGGGLVDSFSSVETMFGPKTSAFLTKATTVLSIVFFITCLSLAVLSSRQSRSLMQGAKPAAPAAAGAAAPAAASAAESPASQQIPQPEPWGSSENE